MANNDRRSFLKTLAGAAGSLFLFKDVKAVTPVPPIPTPLAEWEKGLWHTEAAPAWFRCTGSSVSDLAWSPKKE